MSGIVCHGLATIASWEADASFVRVVFVVKVAA